MPCARRTVANRAGDRPPVRRRAATCRQGRRRWLDQRQQSGEVERHPPQQGRLVGFRRRRELFSSLARIEGSMPFLSSGVVHLGQARPLGWHECPVPGHRWPSGPRPEAIARAWPVACRSAFGWIRGGMRSSGSVVLRRNSSPSVSTPGIMRGCAIAEPQVGLARLHRGRNSCKKCRRAAAGCRVQSPRRSRLSGTAARRTGSRLLLGNRSSK